MSKRDIDINDVRVGMSVVGLDVSWLDSPFLFHTRKIKDEKDIIKLRKSGAKVITIDLSKSDVLPEDPKPEVKAPAPKIEPESKPEPQVTSPKNIRARHEFAEASKLHEQLTTLTQSVFDKMNKGVPVDIAPLDDLISRTISSLSRNNQALFALLHMQRKAGELYEHAFSVFSLTLALAHAMNVSEAEQKYLGYAALIHDAGWLKLPMQLLGKGKAYSDVEKQLVNKHTMLTLKMIGSTEGVTDEIKALVLQHHELSDGSGYPNGASMQNNQAWGILAVADRYDELVHQLLDQPGVVPKNALKILYGEAQKGKLDSAVVQSLISLLGVYPISSAVELSTGEKAVVTECFRDKPTQPVIRIYYDKNGRVISKPLTVNLSKQKKHQQRAIQQVLDPRKQGVDPAKLLYIDPMELM